LRAFASERLTAAKLPREVRVVDAIPRSHSGKALRRALRRTP
jgi:acyl-coenzyme A synthetase/AMP-(fatty) acid ligase